jgi:hypothetical protein
MNIPLSAYPDSLLRATTALTTAYAQITSFPGHPYEAAKFALFGPDYEFPALSSVQIPEGVTSEGIIAKISQLESNYQTKFIDTLINPSDYNIIEANKLLSPLAELSGENTYVVTEQKYKSYIEFVEMINQLDINSINDTNSVEIIQKIGYTCLNMLAAKTT